MFGHHRHRPERSTFGSGGHAVRYQMPTGLLGTDDNCWIEDQSGQNMFQAAGRAVPGHNCLVLADASGRELFRIQDRPGQTRQSMAIQDAGAGASAMVKIVSTTVSDRLIVDLESGAWFDVEGNIPGHEYEIRQGGTTVAAVSKKWLPNADTYGVEVSPGHNDALILAITVCVDQITAG